MANRILNYTAFIVLTLLWLVFAALLLANPAALDSAWQTFRAWPVIAQIVVGLLLLPLVIGLWVWASTWPMLAKIVLIVALAWVTVYTFMPRRAADMSIKIQPGPGPG